MARFVYPFSFKTKHHAVHRYQWRSGGPHRIPQDHINMSPNQPERRSPFAVVKRQVSCSIQVRKSVPDLHYQCLRT